MRYIDANVFIRSIANDSPVMSPAAASLFDRLTRGEERTAVLESTVAEVVFVLGSRALYGFERADIRDRLLPLLSSAGIVLEALPRCVRALDLFVENRAINFTDALVAAACEEDESHELYSYDRGFDRIAGLTRVEP